MTPSVAAHSANISLREYLFPLLLGLLWCILGTLPYLYAYQTTPDGEVFMGFVGRGTPGANGYFMFERQAQDGFHFMENRVTPEPLPRTFWNLEWWALGKFARWTGLSLVVVFHLERITAAFWFALAVYFLAALCLDRPAQRRLATTLVCCGAGLGWIIWCANNGLGMHLEVSRDLKGVNVPVYLVNKPHFIRAGACAALTYAFLLLGARTGKTRHFVYSGLWALAHSAMRPYHILELYTIYAVFPALLSLQHERLETRLFKQSAIAGMVHLPGVLYYVWLAWTDSLGMSGWKRVPGMLIEYFLWCGWPFIVCVVAFLVFPWVLRPQQLRDSTLLLGLWILIAWAICNTYPYWSAGQEAAFYALQIAPAILALGAPLAWCHQAAIQGQFGPGLQTLAAKPRFTRIAAVVLILLSLPTTAVTYGQLFTTLRGNSHGWTFYISQGLLDALKWLDRNTPPSSVVLAAHDTSQFIPRVARNKIVTGHDMLTADYNTKNAEVNRFFANSGDEDFKRALIKRYNVRYILHGPLERQLGPCNPASFPWLRPIHSTSDTTLYEVADSAHPATSG